MNIASATGINSFVQFITLLIVFVIILFLTYATTRFIGGYQKTITDNSNFTVIDTYRVSNNKYIQIIRIGKKYLAISVCKDNITTLTELNEEDICIPDYSGNNDAFSKIFERIKNNRNLTNENKEQQEDGKDE